VTKCLSVQCYETYCLAKIQSQQQDCKAAKCTGTKLDCDNTEHIQEEHIHSTAILTGHNTNLAHPSVTHGILSL